MCLFCGSIIIPVDFHGFCIFNLLKKIPRVGVAWPLSRWGGRGGVTTRGASRTLRRSRFVMKAIDACWWHCRCRPDEVARIAEPVRKEGWLDYAAQAGAQPPKGAIDIAIVLSFEVLQDFLPRPGGAADQ